MTQAITLVASQAPPGVRGLDFDSLYDEWVSEVRRWVRTMKVPAADAEDLVQEVFLVVHRRLGAFDGRTPGGWLFQITRRRVRDHKRSKWVTSILIPGEVGEHEFCSADLPDVAAEAREKHRVLQRLIGELSQVERDALFLFELEGRSGRRIAEIQGIALNTVWSRIHAARRKLSRALEQLEGWTSPGNAKS